MPKRPKICSFNCEGVSRCSEYVHEFRSKYECDLLCLQETWVLSKNVPKLGNILDKCLYTGISGVDSNRDISLIEQQQGFLYYIINRSPNILNVSIFLNQDYAVLF